MSLILRSVLISTLLFFSCASQFENLQTDDDFDRNNLQPANYLLGGLSLGTETKYSKRTRFILSEDMWEQFQLGTKKSEYQKIPDISTAYFIGKFGQHEYLKMMNEFDEEAKLSLKTCHIIREKFPKIDYILFSRLEDHSFQDHSVGVSYYIVDIKSSENVWKASMQTSWKDVQFKRGPAAVKSPRSKSTKNLIKNSFQFFADKFYR